MQAPFEAQSRSKVQTVCCVSTSITRTLSSLFAAISRLAPLFPCVSSRPFVMQLSELLTRIPHLYSPVTFDSTISPLKPPVLHHRSYASSTSPTQATPATEQKTSEPSTSRTTSQQLHTTKVQWSAGSKLGCRKIHVECKREYTLHSMIQHKANTGEEHLLQLTSL